ncbi:hypothetical protein FRC09_008695, partial [Ceratobasidium sp. 395]
GLDDQVCISVDADCRRDYGLKTEQVRGDWHRTKAFGYDQDVISGAMAGFLTQSLRYTTRQLSNRYNGRDTRITSITASRIVDIIGRRRTVFTEAVVFVFGGAIQTFTNRFPSDGIEPYRGQFRPGYALSEVSPAEHREMLACIEFTGNLLDTRRLWVYYFWSFLELNMSWRLPLFIQWAIGSILAGGSLLLPESPRRLVDTDKLDKGQRVIRDGVLNDIPTEPEFNEIKDMVQKDRLVGGRSCLSMWRRYKQRVLVVISSQAFAQLNGINGKIPIRGNIRSHKLTVYLTIPWFSNVNVTNKIKSGTNVTSEAEWIGRGAILMTDINGIICVLSTIPSWGPLPWLYPPKIMPLESRAKGVSMSTATVRLAKIGHQVYPETKGIPLQETDVVFGEGSITGDDDDDSETSSLVRGRLRTYESPAGSQRPSPAPTGGKKGWFQNVFGGGSGGQKYQAMPNEGREGVW